MEINIPQTEHQRLIQQANAAGYEDVQQYVTEHVRALAQKPSAERFYAPNSEELEASAALCDEAIQEIEDGKGIPFDEAMQQIATKHGFRIDR